MRNINLIFGCLLFMLSIFLYYLTTFPVEKVIGTPEYIGPFSFPRFLAVCLGICSLFLVIKALMSKETGTRVFNIAGLKKNGLLILMAGIYILALKTIGFVVPTFLLLFVLNIFLRQKRGKKAYLNAVVLATIATVVAYIGFRVVLNIYLPKGLLPY